MTDYQSATWSGVKGLALFYEAWLPEHPRADIVLVHGYAEHSGRYKHVIEALIGDGYAVWTYDHRGHGRSEGTRGLSERFEYLVMDLSEFVRMVRSRNAGRPIFMLGHSMGGLVSTVYALDYSHNLAGLILSSPAFKVDEHTPLPLLWISELISAWLPHLPTLPFDNSGISRDEAVRAAYLNDPLNYIGPVKARMGRELWEGTQIVHARAQEISLPVLVTIGEQDPIASPVGTADMFSRFSAADKTLQRYPDAYHEVLNEPEQHDMLALIRTWLAERLA